MGSTKIINILKDDTFDEILSLFKDTPAQEVIFVLPKRSKAFSKEAHFAALLKESQGLNKKISLLSSNPQATAMGRAYQFDVMASEPTTKIKKAPAKANFAKMTDLEGELDDVRDDSDAYERDVIVPSDEMVITPSEKEEEDELLHEEDDESKEVDKEKEEVEEVEEEPSSEELEKLEDEPEEEEALETIADPRQPMRPVAAMARRDPVAEVVPVVRRQTIKAREPAPAILDQSPVQQKNLSELEQVWREELSAPNSSIWSEAPAVTAAPHIAPVQSPRGSFNSRKGNMVKKLTIGLAGGALIAFGLVFFVSSGSAQVSIKAVEQKLDFTIKIKASDTYTTMDAELLKLPGQVFNVQKNVKQSFKATGTKDVAQKARGKLTVENKMSSVQTLIATTRFESASGMVFRTLRAVNVPVNGTIEVEVIADKAGKDYNLAPTTFTLPAFKERGDTERFQKITGKSLTAFTGGVVGTAKVVTDLDYSTAQSTVKDQLQKEVSDALAQQTADLVIPKASDPSIQAPESSAKVDEAVDEFTMSITANVKV
ncbi:MAG: baseplate J/gp47 family protein, partial [Candidatus Yanofskybacteria bacterium]|nr:baseplate J/gp47 family protein [Candidatus Yanofskybacteria bacterium]